MALQLPVDFKNDIQSRDTALVPVIVLGKWKETTTGGVGYGDIICISTNTINLRVLKEYLDGEGVEEWEDVVFKPLLLNIPSLKESIDLEKRNYKISSVNIDISNFPYEGQRFSELAGDNSLINTECRIYWIGPTATTTLPWVVPIDELSAYAPASAFQVYTGSIRKYTHDDEKVRLVVEDRSQATLHKDLPTANLGTGDDVPDKYKNKPIPMVYGNVDRSPCVIKSQSDITNADSIILMDSDETISGIIEDEGYEYADRYIKSGLYCYDNIYASVAKSTSGLDVEVYQQWSSTNNKITFNTYLSGSDAELLSSLNLIELEYIAKPNKITSRDWSDQNGMDGDPMSYVSDAKNSLDLNLNNYTELSGDNLLIAISLNLESSPALAELAFEFNDHFGLDLSMARSSFIINTQLVTSIYNSITPNINQPGGMRWNINILETNSHSVDDETGVPLIKQIYLFNDGLSDNLLEGGLDDQQNGRYNNSSSFGIPGASGLAVDINNSDPIEWSNLDNTLPSMVRMAVQGNYEGTLPLQLRFAAIGWKVIGTFIYKNFAELDFYANVIGRTGSGTRTDETIATIMVDELGVSGNVEDFILPAGTEPVHGNENWFHDFTIDKKINSKKLIEGIASASPYIPRFNNMGKFKLDYIPEEGGDVTSEENHHIKNDDVIDFTFSRTPIEDVYTKVGFKYKWDYAREEFEEEVKVVGNNGFIHNYVRAEQITTVNTDYTGYDYYGLAHPTQLNGTWVHEDSTLIIDDDRGKYIRDEETALRFALMMLSWHCNQHIKLKVELPLGKGLNIEIGDIVDFELLGGVKPYGIDYTVNSSLNGMLIYKNFMVTATNKTLDMVEIECIQLHRLYLDPDFTRMPGCTDIDACNYDNAATEDDGNCQYCDCREPNCGPEHPACGGDYTMAENGVGGYCSEAFAENDCKPPGTPCEDTNDDGNCDCIDDCITGGLEYDDCNVCDGGNATMDCNGVCDGQATFDACATCIPPGQEEPNLGPCCGVEEGVCNDSPLCEWVEGIGSGNVSGCYAKQEFVPWVCDEGGHPRPPVDDDTGIHYEYPCCNAEFGFCNCNGLLYDCSGICNGDAVMGDECGDCAGEGAMVGYACPEGGYECWNYECEHPYEVPHLQELLFYNSGTSSVPRILNHTPHVVSFPDDQASSIIQGWNWYVYREDLEFHEILGKHVWRPSNQNAFRVFFEHFAAGMNDINPNSTTDFRESHITKFQINIQSLPCSEEDSEAGLCSGFVGSDNMIFNQISFNDQNFQNGDEAFTQVLDAIYNYDNPTYRFKFYNFEGIFNDQTFPDDWDNDPNFKDYLFAVDPAFQYQDFKRKIRITLHTEDNFENRFQYVVDRNFHYRGEDYLLGDADGNGGCNVNDLLKMIWCILAPAYYPCSPPMYVTDDDVLDIFDIIPMINAILDVGNPTGCPGG